MDTDETPPLVRPALRPFGAGLAGHSTPSKRDCSSQGPDSDEFHRSELEQNA